MGRQKGPGERGDERGERKEIEERERGMMREKAALVFFSFHLSNRALWREGGRKRERKKREQESERNTLTF